MLKYPLHAPPCFCPTCQAKQQDLDSKPYHLDLPVFLPGGFAPRNLAHRFCHECLAITTHAGTTALRSSCTQCGANYSSKAPASPHGAVLWASAQAEIKQMKKQAGPPKHGTIRVGFGDPTADGLYPPVFLSVGLHD